MTKKIEVHSAQPIIGQLMDQISALPVLWGMGEPGALLRTRDVFRVLAEAGRALAVAPAQSAAAAAQGDAVKLECCGSTEFCERASCPAQGDAKNAARLNAAIYEGITRALGEYRMSNMCFADDESMQFPLVDLLSTDGGTIATGQREIEYIADAVYNEVLAAIAAKAAS